MPVYRKEGRSHLRGCSGPFDYAWYVKRRGILPDEYAVHGSSSRVHLINLTARFFQALGSTARKEHAL